MERVIKRIGSAIVAFISVCLIIAIIIVNIKYNKYFKIIELDMTEQYITDWGTVSINGAKILNKDDFITEYTGVEPYIFDTDIYEEAGYMVIDTIFNVTDIDKYDDEWLKLWAIEADNGWSNGEDMLLSAFLNNNIKIVENGIYELYCVYNMGINSMSIGTFDELYKLNYKVLINQNPIVYYKLDINI